MYKTTTLECAHCHHHIEAYSEFGTLRLNRQYRVKCKHCDGFTYFDGKATHADKSVHRAMMKIEKCKSVWDEVE